MTKKCIIEALFIKPLTEGLFKSGLVQALLVKFFFTIPCIYPKKPHLNVWLNFSKHIGKRENMVLLNFPYLRDPLQEVDFMCVSVCSALLTFFYGPFCFGWPQCLGLTTNPWMKYFKLGLGRNAHNLNNGIGIYAHTCK